MARPLRLQFPGALFHVTCRGNEKQAIFRDDSDRRQFLQLLGRCVNRFEWILPAYVLMLNHFHLVLQLTMETLSRGLHWLNGEYARYFNERHGRVGHLLQGRPHTALIEKQTYYLDVLRYAVLNPVRARLVGRPEDYEWSSHRAILGLVPAPPWLAVDDVLAQFATRRDLAQARYACYVDAGIGLEHSPWRDLVGQAYLGSTQWLDTVHQKVAHKPRADEHPVAQRYVRPISMTDVVCAVAETLRVDERRVRYNPGVPRMMAAWIAWHEVLLTNREIAAGLRLRSEGSARRLIKECELELDRTAGLSRSVEQAISTIRGNRCELKV